MRKFIALTLIISFVNSGAQSWKTVTPFNTANVIEDMETTPNGTTYVIASAPGRCYKTSDGLTWSLFTGSSNPSDLFMLDDNNGYLISTFGSLSKTTDGWQTSTNVNYGTALTYDKVFFVNDNVGFISGYRRFVNKTLDGGQTWSIISIPSTLISSGVDITDIHFINEQIGFVVTDDGQVLKTTDQGLTWNMIQLQASSYDLNEILFVDENIGMAVGALGQVYRTIDQGNTWTLIDTDVGNALDIRLHNGVLYLVGNARTFALSTDLGATWSPTQTVNAPNSSLLINNLKAITFRGSDILVAGDEGTIFKANNASGTQWSLFYEGIFGSLVVNDIQFMNSNQGVMVGSSNTQSAIYYSANRGITWQRKALASSSFYRSISMKQDGKGIVVGPAGYSATTNFGQSWSSSIPIQPSSAYTKCWLKNNGDFFIGTNPGAPINDGLIRRSGTNWSQFTNMIQVGEIKFANEQIGFAAVGNSTYPGAMWKTIDGGSTWNPVNSYTEGRVEEIQIVTPDKLYVRSLDFGNWVYSENGGQTWNTVSINFPRRFYFFDEFNAYGINTETKDVYKTVDGGLTWQIIINNDNSLCGVRNFIWFPDRIIQASEQFLVCVLDIESSLQVETTKSNPKRKIIVYPNPTADVLHISEFVKDITVVDITGKKIAHYSYTNQIDVTKFEKGIYFLDIMTVDDVKTIQKIMKY